METSSTTRYARASFWSTALLVLLLTVDSAMALNCPSSVEDDLFIPLVVYFFITVAVGGVGAAYTFLWKSLSNSPSVGGEDAAAASHVGRDSTILPGDSDDHRESWQINYSELRFEKKIGAGSVGEVYSGTYRGRHVAIKKLLGSWFKDEDMVARFKAEIYLMQQMNHVNVLYFIGAVLDKDAGNICLVTELCEKGTLEELLMSTEKITWLRRLKLARAIALGMEYVHTRAGIIQRDLKVSNLLVTRDYDVKIADFGLSRPLAPAGRQMQTYCGTPAYMAPEVIRQTEYDVKCDVYSFDIIMWELLTRQEPYAGEASGLGLAYAVAREGWRPHIPAYCPREWASLMSRCWSERPVDRPSFESVQRELLDLIRVFEKELSARDGPPQAPPARKAAPQPGPPVRALPWGKGEVPVGVVH